MSVALRAVTKTFFDSELVLKRVSVGRRKAMIRSGAFTVRVAKNLFRRPLRKKYEELTTEERTRWKIKAWRAKKQGKPAPKLPFAPSPKEPGKPPRSRFGTLKKHIYFGYDPATDDVVAGSVHFGKAKTAHLLEHGGEAQLPGSDGIKTRMSYAGNPFMAPAVAIAAPRIPDFFRDCVRP